MTEPPEELPPDTVLLLRRASLEALNRATGEVKAVAFKLRTSRGELSLSFFDSSLVSPEEVHASALSPEWGVAAIRTDELRALGFAVARDATGADRLGAAHVSAKPGEVTAGGQLPTELSRRVAMAAHWVIAPGSR